MCNVQRNVHSSIDCCKCQHALPHLADCGLIGTMMRATAAAVAVSLPASDEAGHGQQ